MYRILIDEDTAKGATGVPNAAIGGATTTFTLPRCKLAISDRCACKNDVGPRLLGAKIFPPPPPVRYTEDWNLFEPRAGKTSTSDTQKGDFGFLSARLVNSRSLDFTTRASFSSFSCPGEDDGQRTCGLECSRNHLGKLRAFTVQGLRFNDPPYASHTIGTRTLPRLTLAHHTTATDLEDDSSGLCLGKVGHRGTFPASNLSEGV